MIKKFVIINGEIKEEAEGLISVFDRGYQLGDGVFERIPVYNGRCFGIIPHMDALLTSMIGIKIPGVYTVEELVSFHEELIEKTGLVNGEICVEVTRGDSSYSVDFPEMVIPNITMTVVDVDRTKIEEEQKNGVNVITVKDDRWQRCDINSINRLPEVLAKQSARVSRAHEAVFVRENGNITEATEGNLFLVKDGIIWTHPENNFINNRISRRIVKERIAKELNIPLVEKEFNLEFALTAQEVFLAGVHYEILPITKIDRAFVADKEVGEITRKLQMAYKEFIKAECHI
jgi:D-alanine transaminase